VAQEPQDNLTYYVWVGDDRLDTGPLDMQTLLFLEMGGNDISSLRMERVTAPRNLLSFSPSSLDFLKNYTGKKEVTVIVQLYGIDTSFSDEDFLENGRQWLKDLESYGVRTVLLYPWSSQIDSPETNARLDKLVHQFAWQNNLVLIPIAPAWELVHKEHAEIPLYASDGNHPSAEGVYLSACVLYASLTGKSPLEISARTSVGYDQPQEIVTLDDDVALVLQTAAWQVLQEYEQKGEFQVFLLK
jgi:lysophospholipase L1-like esterase